MAESSDKSWNENSMLFICMCSSSPQTAVAAGEQLWLPGIVTSNNLEGT